jgi:hypothetical protein
MFGNSHSSETVFPMRTLTFLAAILSISALPVQVQAQTSSQTPVPVKYEALDQYADYLATNDACMSTGANYKARIEALLTAKLDVMKYMLARPDAPQELKKELTEVVKGTEPRQISLTTRAARAQALKNQGPQKVKETCAALHKALEEEAKGVSALFEQIKSMPLK